MRFHSLCAQRESLGDAEAVLFVDYGKAQRTKLNSFLEERVRADGDRGSPGGYRAALRFALFLGLTSREPRDFQAERY